VSVESYWIRTTGGATSRKVRYSHVTAIVAEIASQGFATPKFYIVYREPEDYIRQSSQRRDLGSPAVISCYESTSITIYYLSILLPPSTNNMHRLNSECKFLMAESRQSLELWSLLMALSYYSSEIQRHANSRDRARADS